MVFLLLVAGRSKCGIIALGTSFQITQDLSQVCAMVAVAQMVRATI